MQNMALATLIYERGNGEAVDALLAGTAARLRAEGWRLAGATQRPAERADRCLCDMILTDLATGADTTISEDRGPMAKGCRLDARALETVVGSTMAEIERKGADLLIVNKFGRRESEGGGFRPVIALALSEGMAVIVGVSSEYLPAWREFTGGAAVELAHDMAGIADWLAKARPLAAAR